MHEKYVFEGKTTNEAIEKGLKELNVTKNDVEIKVVENEDKRSFFNILTPRIVKVEMELKDRKEERKESKVEKERNTEIKIDEKVLKDAENRVKNFLNQFLEYSVEEKIGYECSTEENVIKIVISDKNADFLIGYRGETLNALQTLLTAVAAKNCKERIKVELDILDYREKRKKALEELAEKIARSVVKTKKSIALEPMTPYERKIIHTKLQNNTKVKTASVGEGTHRKVVISLK